MAPPSRKSKALANNLAKANKNRFPVPPEPLAHPAPDPPVCDEPPALELEPDDIELDEPNHGPPRTVQYMLDELEEEGMSHELDIDILDGLDLAEDSEEARLAPQCTTDSSAFLDLMREAQRHQAALDEAEHQRARKRHNTRTAPRTKRRWAAVRRKFVEGGGKLLSDFFTPLEQGSQVSLILEECVHTYIYKQQEGGDVEGTDTDVPASGPISENGLIGSPPNPSHLTDNVGARVVRADDANTRAGRSNAAGPRGGGRARCADDTGALALRADDAGAPALRADDAGAPALHTHDAHAPALHAEDAAARALRTTGANARAGRADGGVECADDTGMDARRVGGRARCANDEGALALHAHDAHAPALRADDAAARTLRTDSANARAGRADGATARARRADDANARAGRAHGADSDVLRAHGADVDVLRAHDAADESARALRTDDANTRVGRGDGGDADARRADGADVAAVRAYDANARAGHVDLAGARAKRIDLVGARTWTADERVGCEEDDTFDASVAPSGMADYMVHASGATPDLVARLIRDTGVFGALGLLAGESGSPAASTGGLDAFWVVPGASEDVRVVLDEVNMRDSDRSSPDADSHANTNGTTSAGAGSVTLTEEEERAEHALEDAAGEPLMSLAADMRAKSAADVIANVRYLNERRDERTVKDLENLQRQLDYKNLPSLRRAVAKLSVLAKKPDKLGVVLHARVLAMVSTINLYLDASLGLGWRRASVVSARAQGFTGERRARSIRTWIHDYLHSGFMQLPRPAYRGNRDSLLAAEDFSHDLRLYLLEMRQARPIRAQDVVDYVASEAVQQRFGTVSIHNSTGRRWLHRMQWRYGKALKGMYIDGHERDDVVAYRDTFIERWYRDYEPRMVTYDKDGNATYPRGFPVPQGHRFRLFLVTHDESTFYAHDRRKAYWIAPGDKPAPVRKGEGSSLMVSDFLTPDWGRLIDDDGE
jgi:hypothetical protein